MRIIFRLAILISVCSYSAVCGQEILDKYVQEGLRNNEGIKQQEFLLEKNLLALKEARAMFLPTISLNALYTRAQGGRSLDFPLGDLLNPAYKTLNQLTGTNAYPQVENRKILFNPDNYYDAKIHTTLPLVNAEIYFNQKIKKELINFQNAEVNVFRRELVKDIKTAYFKYWQADQAVKIYEQSLQLAKEGDRITKVLHANGKANRTSSSRAMTDILRAEASINEAKVIRENSKLYFDFLLNRTSTEEILIDETQMTDSSFAVGDSTFGRREELKKIDAATEVSSYSAWLAKSYFVPKIGVFLDLGSQAFQWQFNESSRYYFGGVTLEWNLFAFGRNRFKSMQAVQDFKVTQSQKEVIEDQLSLQLSTALNNFDAARISYASAISQVKSSESYYKDMVKQYKEGRALYIELLDAQNQFTGARLQESISKCTLFIRMAEIERSTSSYNLNIKN